jgi:hypothetical protein
MVTQYNGDWAISDKYLGEFLRVVKSRADIARQQETDLLAMRNMPVKPENYQSKLQSACEYADIYAWLSEKLQERYGHKGDVLTASAYMDLIFSYRGRDSQPSEITEDDKDLGAISKLMETKGMGGLYVLNNKSRKDEDLGWLKLSVREYALGDFLGLYHLQEGKVDEWIAKGVLKLENPPADLSKHGVLNPIVLEGRQVRFDNRALDRAAVNYTWALKQYQERPCPGGMLDVFHRAKIQWLRSEFAAALHKTYPDMGKFALQAMHDGILEQRAKEYGMQPNSLGAGINF